MSKSKKVTPICPSCKTIGNMAGTMEGPIFCSTCGGKFTAQEIWTFMQSSHVKAYLKAQEAKGER